MATYRLTEGTLVIGTADADTDVAGRIAITTETATPAQPSDGHGYLYSKSDGKLYWRSYDVTETDLTAGGGSGAVSGVANGADNRVATFSGTDSLNGEANLTFDGSTLSLTGDLSTNSIVMADNQAAALTIKEGSNAYITIVTTNGADNEKVLFSKPPVIADDVPLMFGSDSDWSMSYDEASSDALVLETQGSGHFRVTSDTVTFISAEASDPLVVIKNQTNDANGARLRFVKDRGAPGADNDVCGIIEFYGDDDNQDNILFAKIEGIVADASNGDECGKLAFYVAENDGNNTAGLSLIGSTTDGEVDVTIGAGAASVVTIPGVLSVANDIILDDGGSIKEAGGTAAITIDASGHVTKIGQDSPSSGEFLKWDGSKAVWDSASTTSKLSAFVNGYLPLSTTATTRMVNFVDLVSMGENATGATSLKTRLVAPFDGTVKTVIITMKHNATPDSSNTGNQTINIYKNQSGGGTPFSATPSYTATYPGSDYSLQASNIDGSGQNIYTKVLSPNLSVSQGDHLHVTGKKTSGVVHDGHISIVMQES